MTESELIPAKATTPAERTDSIVVSFGVEWHEHLLGKRFSIVIRKRIPKSPSFRWLYFHINSPVSAICARARIKKLFTASSKEVLSLAAQIHLKPEEIQTYLAGDNSIGCYELGAFQFSSLPVSTTALAARMAYHPPQSFFILSKHAKDTIDRLANFSATVPTAARKAVKK